MIVLNVNPGPHRLASQPDLREALCDWLRRNSIDPDTLPEDEPVLVHLRRRLIRVTAARLRTQRGRAELHRRIVVHRQTVDLPETLAHAAADGAAPDGLVATICADHGLSGRVPADGPTPPAGQGRCACPCRRPLTAGSASPHFATGDCQAQWHAARAHYPAEVYASRDAAAGPDRQLLTEPAPWDGIDWISVHDPKTGVDPKVLAPLFALLCYRHRCTGCGRVWKPDTGQVMVCPGCGRPVGDEDVHLSATVLLSRPDDPQWHAALVLSDGDRKVSRRVDEDELRSRVDARRWVDRRWERMLAELRRDWPDLPRPADADEVAPGCPLCLLPPAALLDALLPDRPAGPVDRPALYRAVTRAVLRAHMSPHGQLSREVCVHWLEGLALVEGLALDASAPPAAGI